MAQFFSDLASIVSQAYAWGTTVAIAFTAAALAVALIQFLYWKS